MSENKTAEPVQTEQELRELQRIRREKLAALQQGGKDPFEITKFDVSHHSAEIKNNFDELEGKDVSVAGRMMAKRIMGKASFCHVQDLQGTIQSYIARDCIGEEAYADAWNRDGLAIDCGAVADKIDSLLCEYGLPSRWDPRWFLEPETEAEAIERELLKRG